MDTELPATPTLACDSSWGSTNSWVPPAKARITM